MKKVFFVIIFNFIIVNNIFSKDLDCEYLKTKTTALLPEDLPCLIQELPKLMKEKLELPKVIDDKTKLVDVVETKIGKELSYFYEIEEKTFNPFDPSDEIRNLAYLLTIKDNCSNSKFMKFFNLGADFKFVYIKNNEILFNFLINKKVCNDFQE